MTLPEADLDGAMAQPFDSLAAELDSLSRDATRCRLASQSKWMTRIVCASTSATVNGNTSRAAVLRDSPCEVADAFSPATKARSNGANSPLCCVAQRAARCGMPLVRTQRSSSSQAAP